MGMRLPAGYTGRTMYAKPGEYVSHNGRPALVIGHGGDKLRIRIDVGNGPMREIWVKRRNYRPIRWAETPTLIPTLPLLI